MPPTSSLYAGIFSEKEPRNDPNASKDTDSKPSSWSPALRFVPRKRAAPSTHRPSTKSIALATVHTAPSNPKSEATPTSSSIRAPPPLLIPASELERDKRRARILAEERGDIPQREYQDDQDIPKPNRWHRSKTAYLPRMNYAADYDPSRPNDYTQFKAQVQEWRMQRGLYDESESDHDDRPHNPRFAPPTSYAPVAGPYSLMEVVAPSTPTPTAPPPPSAALPPGPPPVPPPSLQARTAKVEPKPSAPAFVRASDHLDTPPSPLPISQAQVDSDPSTFAERLMAKYGYKEGEGLGAEGNKGIVTPLQASHIPAKGKRRRGAIINENVDAEQEYTKSRYGNPSEVIVLTSFSTAQATEEELRQAISTECKHYGFVQRIQLYPMENEQRVQAFVLFTGMAGAYRAVRAMDGWSYGNEYIRCRYYPASSFHAGHLVALQSGST